MNLGVYLHIPFCRSKCDYCAFYSVPVGNLRPREWSELSARYAGRLVSEIMRRENDFRNYRIDTVYFGGGTPSLLGHEPVRTILEALDRYIGFSAGPLEITLECNPEDFSIKRIRDYIDAGINRVVLGLQTLERENRTFIGRSSPAPGHRIVEKFMDIQGIHHCLDLIIGIPSGLNYLPGEIAWVSSLGADHISAYLLSVEENTPLARRFHEQEDFQEMQREAFMATRQGLLDGGYRHYEVSNFCLPGRESRHNMKYWKFMPYAGFGAGAHSFYGSERFINRSSLEEYMKSDTAFPERDERSGKNMIAEYVFTGMRLFEGVSARDFENTLKTGFPADILERLKTLSEKGYVRIFEESDFRAGFSLDGMMIMDTLLDGILDGYL